MKATQSGRIECGRDALTGRFIPVKAAKKRKATAIVTRLKAVRLKNGRFAKQRVGA